MKVVGNKECNCRFQDSLLWDITITETMMCAEREMGEGTCFVSYNSFSVFVCLSCLKQRFSDQLH